MSRRERLAGLVLGALLGALLLSPGGAAAQLGLQVHRLEDGGVRVDGMLREWPRRLFTQVGSGPDASMGIALAHDERGLYVAARVRDERLVRTPPAGEDDDAVILSVAFPRTRAWNVADLWLWPGGRGPLGLARAEAALRLRVPGDRRFHRIRGAKVVEMAEPGRGWSLEAFVPWRALRHLGNWEGAAAVARLHDVDRFSARRAEHEPTSAPLRGVPPRRWPRLRWRGGHHEAFAAFLEARGKVGLEPEQRLEADLGGDGRRERVALVGDEIVVWGPGHRDGQGFDALKLPVDGPGAVGRIWSRDVTGDGKRELFVPYWQRLPDGRRRVLGVYRLQRDGLRPIGLFETARRTEAGELRAELRVRRARRGPAAVEVRAKGGDVDPARWRPAPDPDVEPVPLPWSERAWRRYRWDGRRLREEAAGPLPRLRRRYRVQQPEPEAAREEGAARGAGAEAPAAPPAPSDEALLRAAARQASVEHPAPRRLLRANLLGGRAPERLFLLRPGGRTLAVVGPDVGGGRGYLLWRAAGQGRLVRARAADLDGDGRAEALVEVDRDLGPYGSRTLVVLDAREDGLRVVGAVEVARWRGEDRVEATVRIEGRGRRARLLVGPGRARGFSRDNWPFAPEPPGATVAPVPLPWRDRRPVRWAVRGGRLVRLSGR